MQLPAGLRWNILSRSVSNSQITITKRSCTLLLSSLRAVLWLLSRCCCCSWSCCLCWLFTHSSSDCKDSSIRDFNSTSFCSVYLSCSRTFSDTPGRQVQYRCQLFHNKPQTSPANEFSDLKMWKQCMQVECHTSRALVISTLCSSSLFCSSICSLRRSKPAWAALCTCSSFSLSWLLRSWISSSAAICKKQGVKWLSVQKKVSVSSTKLTDTQEIFSRFLILWKRINYIWVARSTCWSWAHLSCSKCTTFLCMYSLYKILWFPELKVLWYRDNILSYTDFFGNIGERTVGKTVFNICWGVIL